jgi:hypothetical protein
MFRRLRQRLFPPKGTRLYKLTLQINNNPVVKTKGYYRSDAEAISAIMNTKQDLFTEDTRVVLMAVWRGGSCIWRAKGKLHEEARLDFSTEHFIAGD